MLPRKTKSKAAHIHAAAHHEVISHTEPALYLRAVRGAIIFAGGAVREQSAAWASKEAARTQNRTAFRSQINPTRAANIQEDFLMSPFLMPTVLSNSLPREHLHRLTLGQVHGGGGSTAGGDLLCFLQGFCSTSLPQLRVSSQLTPS